MSDDGAAPALQASLLATEHWGLLAARGTAQSEVLTRISMLLTLISAGLVSLALVGQVTEFAAPFQAISIGVLAFTTAIGQLTQLRVNNVGEEDLMYVLAMNRMRAAYLDLAPEVAPYLMASAHDDMSGAERTYFFLGRRRPLKQFAAASTTFVMMVNGALVGLLAADLVSLSDVDAPIVAVTGAVLGVVYVATVSASVGRSYFGLWRNYRPLRPSRAGAAGGPGSAAEEQGDEQQHR
jgi:hypothetical protein